VIDESIKCPCIRLAALRPGYPRTMTHADLPGTTARSRAIESLFVALEDVMTRYQQLPDDDRARTWDRDADRITGELARHLSAARSKLSSCPTPASAAPTATAGATRR
jgi:hypothetical protein